MQLGVNCISVRDNSSMVQIHASLLPELMASWLYILTNTHAHAVVRMSVCVRLFVSSVMHVCIQYRTGVLVCMWWRIVVRAISTDHCEIHLDAVCM